MTLAFRVKARREEWAINGQSGIGNDRHQPVQAGSPFRRSDTRSVRRSRSADVLQAPCQGGGRGFESRRPLHKDAGRRLLSHSPRLTMHEGAAQVRHTTARNVSWRVRRTVHSACPPPIRRRRRPGIHDCLRAGFPVMKEAPTRAEAMNACQLKIARTSRMNRSRVAPTARNAMPVAAG